MQSGYIAAGKKGGQLFYRRFGNGPKILLAFPGYSNTALLYQPLATMLDDQYSVYAFDLPHHGQNKWPAGVPLLKEDLVSVVKNILHQNKQEQCALTAFSLGGRVALCIEEQAPELIEKIALVAPDGLSFNPFYRFLTGTFTGKRLFSNFTEQPDSYLKILDWLHHKKWLDPSRYHFAKYFVKTGEARRFLYDVWTDMRFLKPNLKIVRHNLKQYQTPACIFMGKQDHVIPAQQAEAFAKGQPTVQVTVLNKGHRLMDHDTFQRLSQCLLS